METKLNFACERTKLFPLENTFINIQLVSKCYGKIFYFHRNSIYIFKYTLTNIKNCILSI